MPAGIVPKGAHTINVVHQCSLAIRVGALSGQVTKVIAKLQSMTGGIHVDFVRVKKVMESY